MAASSGISARMAFSSASCWLARDGDVAALPGGDALRQSGVVERAAPPEDRLKLALLFGRRPQLLLERCAHGLCHLSASSVRQCSAEWSPGSQCRRWLPNKLAAPVP